MYTRVLSKSCQLLASPKPKQFSDMVDSFTTHTYSAVLYSKIKCTVRSELKLTPIVYMMCYLSAHFPISLQVNLCMAVLYNLRAHEVQNCVNLSSSLTIKFDHAV